MAIQRPIQLVQFTDEDNDAAIAQLLAHVASIDKEAAAQMRKVLDSSRPGARLIVTAANGSPAPQAFDDQLTLRQITPYAGQTRISRSQFCGLAVQANRPWNMAADLFRMLCSLNAVPVTTESCGDQNACVDRRRVAGPWHAFLDVTALLALDPDSVAGLKADGTVFLNDHIEVLRIIQRQLRQMRESELTSTSTGAR